MSEFFKSKKKFGFALGAVFIAITLVMATFAFTNQGFAAGLAGDPVKAGVSVGEQGGKGTVPVTEGGWGGEEDSSKQEGTSGTTITPTGTVSSRGPGEMKGAFLLPGVDFLKSGDASKDAAQSEVDEALE